MHGLFMRWVEMLSWVISALAAVNIGLAPFGFDFFQTEYMLMHPQFIEPVCYVVLAAGLISLALFVMALAGHCVCNGCKGK